MIVYIDAEGDLWLAVIQNKCDIIEIYRTFFVSLPHN